MEWLAAYGLFIAKAITMIVAVAVVVGLIARGRRKGSGGHASPSLEIVEWNARFDKRRRQLQLAGEPKSRRRRLLKKLEKDDKRQRDDKTASAAPRVWVVDFEGDLKASETPALAEIVSLLIAELASGDEVVLRLSSGGGLVHSYGLAAAQLDRLREAGATLTVCVDKVAASGGYMMACCAHRLIAAPFAVIGSIGVVAQIPNVHRLLKRHDVDVELLTAGRYKRTLTVLGENDEAGRAKFLEDLESTHVLFKRYVSTRRPGLDIERVATGEIWYGSEALDIGLIDEVGTSEAYLLDKLLDRSRVLGVSLAAKRGVMSRLGLAVERGAERGVDRLIERVGDLRWQRR